MRVKFLVGLTGWAERGLYGCKAEQALSMHEGVPLWRFQSFGWLQKETKRKTKAKMGGP